MNISQPNHERFNEKFAGKLSPQHIFEHEVCQATLRNLKEGKIEAGVRNDDSFAFEHSVKIAMAEVVNQLRSTVPKITAVPMPEKTFNQLCGLSDVEELMKGDLTHEEKIALAEKFSS